MLLLHSEWDQKSYISIIPVSISLARINIFIDYFCFHRNLGNHSQTNEGGSRSSLDTLLTYLVQHVLAPQFLPIKVELMSRFVKFFKSLLESTSFEMCLMAKIACSDVRSITKKNLSFIEANTELNPHFASPSEIKYSYVPQKVPRNQEWRFNLLLDLLNERRQLDACMKNTEIITHMIDSLCYS